MLELKHSASIKSVTWDEVRKRVEIVNPPLFAIIEKLNPSKEFTLFVAKYPFGKIVFKQGKMQLPTIDGTVESMCSSTVMSNISSQLMRRPVPMTLVLKNSAEVFYEMQNRIISLNFFTPGVLFGLWENLDPQQSYCVKWVWSVTSGARSIYMLPKITEVAAHKELRKKYNIRSQVPRNLSDHWRIFAEIANSQSFNEEWHTELLYFSDKWVDMAVKDKGWCELYNFLLQEGWNQTQYWRNKVTFDIVWEIFANQLIKQNIKPNPYLVSIMKHLVMVGVGVLPGLTVSNNEQDISAPVKSIQDAYLDVYKLRDYIPTIFRPSHFTTNNVFPVYYSLQQPSLLETALQYKNIQSIYSIMPEIMFLMDNFKSEVLQGEIKSENTPIDVFAKQVICDYFHSDADGKNAVLSTKVMPKEDTRLVSIHKRSDTRFKKFAEVGHLVRGCVRFTAKKRVMPSSDEI